MIDQSRVPSPPVPQKPVERLEYQPVSLCAVFGLLLGAGVALLVLGNVVLAVVSGETTYLPFWIVLIAVAGGVVSFIGWWQIGSSEGTRTGAGLAWWGMWLSALSGVGTVVFTMITELALKAQANSFVMVKAADDEGKIAPDTGFMPRLFAGVKGDPVQFNCAFLLTVPDRGGVDPKNERTMRDTFDAKSTDSRTLSQLSRFRDNAMVRFLRDALRAEPESQVQVKAMGVQKWEFVPPAAKGGGGYYRIMRVYQIATPEISREFLLDVRSVEPAGAGQRRKWFLAPPQPFPQGAFATPLGEACKALRKSAFFALQKWNRNDVKDRLKKIDKTSFDKLVPDKDRRRLVEAMLKEIDDLEKVPQKLELEKIQEFELNPYMCPCKQAAGKVEIAYPVEIKFYPTKTESILLKGFVTLVSEGPVNLSDFTPESPMPSWRISALHWMWIGVAEMKTSR